MADQTITPVVAAQGALTALTAGNYASLTDANDGVLDLTDLKDGKYLLHIKATAETTIAITAGDGSHSIYGDLGETDITINHERLVTLDSARFKNLGGADKGKVRITADAATAVACFQIP